MIRSIRLFDWLRLCSVVPAFYQFTDWQRWEPACTLNFN